MDEEAHAVWIVRSGSKRFTSLPNDTKPGVGDTKLVIGGSGVRDRAAKHMEAARPQAA